MSGTRIVALGLLAAGATVGAVAAWNQTARSADPGALATLGSTVPDDAVKVERRRLEARVIDAAMSAPLLAALANPIDGATMVDLFRSEDWWRDVREEFTVTRLVVGSQVLATFGLPDPGTADSDVIADARRNPVASAVVTVDGQRHFVVASRLDGLPNRFAVLVLMKPVVPALLVAPTPVVGPSFADAAPARRFEDMGLVAVAVMLALGGVLLIASPWSGPATIVVRPRDTTRQDTLKFGSRTQQRAAVEGAVAPRAPASGPPVTIRMEGMGTSAPATFRVAPTPGPVGPPRRTTLPGGVPFGESGKPGQAFGRYQLLERLGQGGMAEVFTAVAHGVEGFTRVFVLKRLRPELSQDKEAVSQFIDEARMQSNLVHSNIVPVFDFGRVASEYFMTQEYIVGRDLVRLIARYYDHAQQTLPPLLGYYIAHETLQALQYAHQRRDREGNPLGIVHRDVSAGNIIVSAQGEVKLADFGIVKFNRRVSKTQTGMVKGNANFMSPEQARGQAVDARTDLYSVALVLYYCLTNRLLYDGDNDLDVLYKAASGPTEKDCQAIAALPAPAGALLTRALAADPADRFQTAAEFADALAPHIAGASAEAARLMQALFGDELAREAA